MTNLLPEFNLTEWLENSATGNFFYISIMLAESL